MPFGTYATPQSTFDNAVKLMQGAIRAYIRAVKDKSFPATEHCF